MGPGGMSMNKQRTLIRQELSESLLRCMDEIVCFAGDLVSAGETKLPEAIRSLVGEIENLVLNMREGGKYHG